MPRINDRVVDVILSRLRAGEPFREVADDYWVPDLREPALYFVHHSDLEALFARLLAFAVWQMPADNELDEAAYQHPREGDDGANGA